MPPRRYIAIDLKSFYASVECVERGLDPLDACLVVADGERTNKTICLAVSPALKAYGTGPRPRLFEVERRISEANLCRRGPRTSTSAAELARTSDIKIDYIVAPPRMALYIEYSRMIYDTYLRYVAPEDIHVYSVDEVFIDATPYLKSYRMTAHELCLTMIRDVLARTGITATAGIASNMYLCKVAMDIVAKKMKPDADGVRIAELDELTYRRRLWSHRPLTDFWRVGPGIARKLSQFGITTMGDLARFSLKHECDLYRLFGVNAELLIDHAWGYEPVTMEMVKSYRPATRSISSGQVLQSPYSPEQARNVAMEMADTIALRLVENRMAAARMVLTVGYDVESLANPDIRALYTGPVHIDHYGRPVPAHSRGTLNLIPPTSSGKTLMQMTGRLYDRIINPDLLIRRLNISVGNLIDETRLYSLNPPVHPSLFTDSELGISEKAPEKPSPEKERRCQEAILNIKKRYGKNAILKGLNFKDGATQRTRNTQIGGHKA